MKEVWNLQRPVVAMEPVRFIDFANFTQDGKRPLYFTVVRDPVERFVSW